MDVRAERGTEEVQNREVGSVDWMLKWNEARRKSKIGKPEE